MGKYKVAMVTAPVMARVEAPCLGRFEEKIIDDLAIAMIDPYSDQEALAHQVISAALKLSCNPVQAAIEAARTATAVLTTTRRHEGFFGAVSGDFYFDLDEAKAPLKESRRQFARPRPYEWWERQTYVL